MKFRALWDSFLIVLLLGGALFVFLFGSGGCTWLLYSYLSADTQKRWWEIPPTLTLDVGYNGAAMIAMIMVFGGGWFLAGLTGSVYPKHRKVALRLVLVLWAITGILAVLAYRHSI